jgi:hypothetical protein
MAIEHSSGKPAVQRRYSGTLLISQVFLGFILIVSDRGRSTTSEIVGWVTFYVIFSIALQIVSVRYWNRHPRS